MTVSASAEGCVLGLDLGTSSLKAVLVTPDGRRLARAEWGYPTLSPAPGHAEQDPACWLQALGEVVAALRLQSPTCLSSLTAIGLCSAAHLPVLLDGAGRVLRPAILWSDQRSGEQVLRLEQEAGAAIRDLCWNEPGCTWTLPQLLWVWQHEPGVRTQVRHVLSSKDYLLLQLTGECLTDPASAVATLMAEPLARRWSADLVSLAGLSEACLPDLVGALEMAGRVTPVAAALLGLPQGTPVICGSLDSAAELVGCGVLRTGDGGMVRVGSAGGVMALDQTTGYRPGFITYPWIDGQCLYRQAGTNACATALRWAARGLGLQEGETLDHTRLDEVAGSVPAGSEGLLFHPYLMGERAPWWNPDLRGSFTGLELRHGRGHLLRAVMEGVSHSLRDCLAMFEAQGVHLDSAVMTGGITRGSLWPSIIADVLGITLRTVPQGDSATGAALMAAAGIGGATSLEEICRAWISGGDVLEPDPNRARSYESDHSRYRRVARMLVEISAGE